MPAEPTSRDPQSERDATAPQREGVTLTDLFDQMDRAAFRRSLEQRDNIMRNSGHRTSR